MAESLNRSREELLMEAKVQIKFLKNECALYDAGDPDYGRQIATKLRVLLHDTDRSRSVLRQLTEQFMFNRPDFLDLSSVRGELPKKGQTDFVRASLCQYQLIHQLDAPPVLTVQPLEIKERERYPLRAFNTWWRGIDVVLVDRHHFLSRKDVVGLLANRDGGAHVDPKLGEVLDLLNRRKANPLRIIAALPDGQRREYVAQIDQVLAATVRTIGTETLYMFQNQIIPYCEAHN